MQPESERDKRATDGLTIRNAEGLDLRNLRMRWQAQAPEAKWAHGLALHTVRDFQIAQFNSQSLPKSPQAAVLLADTQRGVLAWPLLEPIGPVYCQVTGSQTKDLHIQTPDTKKLPQLVVDPAARKSVVIMR